MAKGDDARSRNRIDYEKGLAQNNLNNLRSRVVDQQYPMFFDNYRNAVTQQEGERKNLLSGYGEFAKTGGFSPLDVMNMRSRSMAPNRGIFDAARRGIQRFGGPARTAALSRLQRETGQAMSDTATATEANIAGLRQQGRLAGLGGLGQTYAATPGLVNMYGNQLQQNTGQQLGIEELQGRLGLGTMNAQIQASQLPGKWEHNMGRIMDVANLGTSILSPWQRMMQQGGNVPLPNSSIGGQWPTPPPNYYGGNR